MEPRPESLNCPRCNKLISGYLDECSGCGLANPASKAKWFGLLTLGGGSLIRPIIGLCILTFGMSYLLPMLIPLLAAPTHSGLFGLLPSPSSKALAVLGWADPRSIFSGQWHLLITAIFLHGGVLHILFNMLWVRDLGAQAEALLGPRLMVLAFVLTGIGGNLLAVYWPFFAHSLGVSSSFTPLVGASGAVFGLMGVIMSYAPRKAGFMGLGLARQMGKWALVLILLGFLMPGVSNLAHIGGFVSGWLLGKLIPLGRGRTLFESAGLFSLGLVIYAFATQFLLVSDWLSST